MLSCTIDENSVDFRIFQEPLLLLVYLKLPQSYYDTSTGDITQLKTPVNPPSQVKYAPNAPVDVVTNFPSLFSLVDNTTILNEFSTSSNPPLKIPMPSKPTSKMSHLLGLNNRNGTTVVIFFSPMNFLDDQTSFSNVFGSKPILFGINPYYHDADHTGSKLRAYADKYTFDIFLDICKEDYVGLYDGGSESKMVYEICKTISSLHMEY